MQKCKKRVTRVTPSVLIYSSCANFLGLHTISCKILLCCKFLQIFAHFCMFLRILCTHFRCYFFKLKVVSVIFFKLVVTLGVVGRLELNGVILYAEIFREQYHIMFWHTLRDCWELVRSCSLLYQQIRVKYWVILVCVKLCDSDSLMQ